MRCLGDVIGNVGATGRAHLHLGIRWLAARVDPQPPPGSPLNLHDVGETSALAERRIENAKTEPVESHQSRLRDDEG